MESQNHIEDNTANGEGFVDQKDGLSTPDHVNLFARGVIGSRAALFKMFQENKKRLQQILFILSLIAYTVYFISSVLYHLNDNGAGTGKGWDSRTIDWCGGLGLLVIMTVLVYGSLFYYFVLKRLIVPSVHKSCLQLFPPQRQRQLSAFCQHPWLSVGVGLGCTIATVGLVVWDTRNDTRRLISATGVVAILLLGFLLSKNPAHVKWSQVLRGLGLQFLLALFTLRYEGGRRVFHCISDKVTTFLDYSDVGSGFVYSYLAIGLNGTNADPQLQLLPVFAFRSLSVVFFFGFCISLLYHYGTMMWIVTKVGWFLQLVIGTTAVESTCAAANVFVGMTESPLLVQPFLREMTNSELHAVMTCGFSMIAGSVLSTYISFGINSTYLLSSCIMSAPGSLALSKLFYPETKVSKTTFAQIQIQSQSHNKIEGNALDAATRGAAQSILLVANIIANLIAFMAFIAFLNGVSSWLGSLIGLENFTFETLLGKLLIPAVWLMGIGGEEAEEVAVLFGLKTVANELVAYKRLNEIQNGPRPLSARTEAIVIYGLCSFANLSSMGIQLAGMASLVPERRRDLAQVVGSALLAGTVCGFLNASIAGALIS